MSTFIELRTDGRALVQTDRIELIEENLTLDGDPNGTWVTMASGDRFASSTNYDDVLYTLYRIINAEIFHG